MIGAALKQNIPVVNAENACSAVHQRHGMRWSGHPASGRNRKLVGNTVAWINDSTHKLRKKDVFNA